MSRYLNIISFLQVLLQSNEDLSEAEEEKKPFFEDRAYIEDDTHLQLQDDEAEPPGEDDFEPYVEDDDHLQLQSQDEDDGLIEPQPIHSSEPEPESQQEDLETPLLEKETKR